MSQVSVSLQSGVRTHTIRKQAAQQPKAQQWGVVSRGFAPALAGYRGTGNGTLYATFATQQAAEQYVHQHRYEGMRLYAKVIQLV